MRDSFATFRVISWHFFPFSTLTISPFCLLPSRVSDEKFTDNLYWGFSVCDDLLLSCCFQDSLSLAFNCLIIMYLNSLSSLAVVIYVFHPVWEVWGHYFFKYSLYPFVSFPPPFWSIWWCPIGLLYFPCISDSKESACNAGDLGLIPGLGRSPGEWNGHPLQYSFLENSMDRGAWWATVHGVAKSWAQLSDSHFHFHRSLMLCSVSVFFS